MMFNHLGVITNKANFTGHLSKIWDKAMKKANIESGFKSCGIFPYNPSAIPSYSPNYVLVTNPDLFNQQATQK